MKRIRLGVNIDHVATVRNARGELYPSPLRAALLAEKYGADSVTIHLREDRRHINESDLKKIIKRLKIPLNLEIAATKEMLRIATKSKPSFVCIVPEKRKEITTEGGLNLYHNKDFLKFSAFESVEALSSNAEIFVTPSTKLATSSPNSFLTVSYVTLVSSIVSCNKPVVIVALSNFSSVKIFATATGCIIYGTPSSLL